ncbi:MAG: hypothetical protein L0332_06090 [Chloroflexi bacterium]|nr:hypothetical protein [Chloroflexota bacterium]MCI0575517.1 hypothetical protein [Chloroflexota bacterium]MCI0644294.1 hypothetical protein [Chloroflexota bacterium]MCI0726277.1 hypothetical protein [Chloroflexota bacterium]
MLLSFRNGRPFATGSMPYEYPPPGSGEVATRILVTVAIGSQQTRAILDTGAPYVICDPRLIPHLPITSTSTLEQTKLLIRGHWVRGTLHRLPVNFLAVEGEDLEVDATVFLPDLEADSWGNLPSFIGLTGCLERIRFAVDPGDDTFYFGPL